MTDEPELADWEREFLEQQAWSAPVTVADLVRVFRDMTKALTPHFVARPAATVAADAPEPTQTGNGHHDTHDTHEAHRDAESTLAGVLGNVLAEIRNIVVPDGHALVSWPALVQLVKDLIDERDLAIAHDRQPYPTADAYESACRALEKHRDRADTAEAERDEARLQRDAIYGEQAALIDDLTAERDESGEKYSALRAAIERIADALAERVTRTDGLLVPAAELIGQLRAALAGHNNPTPAHDEARSEA